MKPVLMIHEVNELIFELPLSNYILTFDDGLYSQFYYLDKFRQFDTEMIFFISSNIVCQGIQKLNNITCKDAHRKAFNGDYEDYMSLDQIKIIANTPNCYVGGHSHYHKNLKIYGKLTELLVHIKSDTDLMFDWFETNLGYRPTKFCLPYNYDKAGLYTAYLKKHGVTEVFGRERIPVEKLLRDHNLTASLSSLPAA